MPRPVKAAAAPVTVVDALAEVPELGNPAVANTPVPAGLELLHLPVEQLVASDVNPRADLDLDDEFTASIATHGVLEPLIVAPQIEGPLFDVISGHRRLAAAIAVGLTQVPAVVRPGQPGGGGDAEVLRLVENLQRRDLSPVDEARAYQRLISTWGMSQAEVAAQVGRNQGHVSKRLKMLALGDAGLALVADGRLNLEDAVDLARMPAGVRTDVVDAVERGLASEVQVANARIRLAELAERGQVLKALKAAGTPFVDLAAKGAEVPDGFESAVYITGHSTCPDRLVVVKAHKGWSGGGMSWTEEYCSADGIERHEAERLERNHAAADRMGSLPGVISKEAGAAAKAAADGSLLRAGLAEARVAHCVKVLSGKLPRTIQEAVNRGVLAMSLTAVRAEATVAAPAPALIGGIDALTAGMDRDTLLRTVVAAHEGSTADVALRLALATLMATGEFDFDSALEDHMVGRELDWDTPVASWYYRLLITTGYQAHDLESETDALIPSPADFMRLAPVDEPEAAAASDDDEYATPDDEPELAEVDAIRAADIEAGHDGAADLA